MDHVDDARRYATRMEVVMNRIVLAMSLVLTAAPAIAQLPGGMIKDAAPDVGEMIPNVTVLDEKGDEFEMYRLKGKYTVLVFGCLT